jgi:hypothetical protein
MTVTTTAVLLVGQRVDFRNLLKGARVDSERRLAP